MTSYREHVVRRYAAGRWEESRDALTVEEPLEIVARGPLGEERTVAVTMRTPGHDRELALGFLFCENLVERTESLIDAAAATSNRMVVQLSDAAMKRLASGLLDRHTVSASSCGLCGRTSLEGLRRSADSRSSREGIVGRDVLLSLPEKLRRGQDVFDRTGGLHAAALFTRDGALLGLWEDVGRHNAVDKLAGHALLHSLLPLDRHVVLVSGRPSFEIVQKASALDVSVLAAVSAPSNLAVKTAWESGVCLVGFLRGDRFNVYAHPEVVLP